MNKQKPASNSNLGSWIPCIVFAVIAVVLFASPIHSSVKTVASPEIDPADLATTSRRTPLGDPPLTKINGFQRDCQDCHKLFKSGTKHNDGKLQHGHVKLQHGMNDDCLNCHLKEDRNKLRLHGNKQIGFSKSEMLCAQCHGTTYRDWKSGIHGKAQGSWEKYDEKRTMLTCVACHDPHSPAFPAIKPLPGPQTLRMDDVKKHHPHYDSSLMQWLNEDESHSEEHEAHDHE